MKRNHDDDLPAQLSDIQLERNTEDAAGSAQVSNKTATDPQFAQPGSWVHGDKLNDAELSAHFRTPVSPKKNKLSRRLLAAVALLVVIIGGGIALFNNFGSRSVKVNVTTKQPSQIQDATARPDKAPDDVTAEAIAEVRSAISNPSAGATSPSSAASVVPGGSQNITAPLSSTVLPPEASASAKSADAKQHERSTSEVSKRNREQSIRFAGDDAKVSIHEVDLGSLKTEGTSSRPNKSPSNSATGGREPARSESRFVANVSRSLSTKPSIAQVVLPSFGSILPVRTLGKIYTLRSGSSIRLELTRYVSGEGWSLSKGTVLIGQIRGSERDRAFVAITGFIAPSRDRFVTLAGETLGDDGGSGIRGKFHKLSSGWSRAFARVGSAAVNVAGAVAGSRISGQPVIITDVGSRTISPFSYEVDSHLLNQARGFVEVPAGTPGFVMVTTLPADVKGVDAEPDRLAQSLDTTTASAESGGLTQEELAVLLTSGDTTRIREALPRMSPQMRRVAETLLSEKQSDRE
ncbi:MAG: hypothetical protein WAU45_03290 [Blastocatellia bacterium]